MEPIEVRTIIHSDIMKLGKETTDIVGIRDIEVPHKNYAIPVRIYTPEGMGALPMLLYVHGGERLAGSIETHDNICRRLALRVGFLVLSVGYRLARSTGSPFRLKNPIMCSSGRWIKRSTSALTPTNCLKRLIYAWLY